MQSIYDLEMVRPMRDELEKIGVRSLRTAGDVNRALINGSGTTLLFINSVCSSAAGRARPAVALALQHKVIPHHLTSVFAGVDLEATMRAREIMNEVPPSSPSLALFKNGALVYVMHRRQFEGMAISGIVRDITGAFDRFCANPGPSVAYHMMTTVFGSFMGF